MQTERLRGVVDAEGGGEAYRRVQGPRANGHRSFPARRQRADVYPVTHTVTPYKVLGGLIYMAINQRASSFVAPSTYHLILVDIRGVRMKGPAMEAVRGALNDILRSIYQENGLQNLPETRSPSRDDVLEPSPTSLTDMVDALRVSLTAVELEVASRTADLYKLQNSLQVPWYRLPAELQSEILIEDLHSQGRPFSRLKDLSQVAFAWREVITSTSSFWTDIVLDPYTPDRIPYRLALKWSSGVPLNITFVIEDGTDVAHLDSFFDAITTVASQWKALRLITTGKFKQSDINAYIVSTLPQLEQLSVENAAGGVMDFVESPRLTLLRIFCVEPTSWSAVIAPRLRDLEIGSNYMQWNDLANLLSTCAGLQSLLLRTIHSTHDAALQDDQPTIVLPRLQRLRLDYVTEGVLLPLVSSIHAPALSHFGMIYHPHLPQKEILLDTIFGGSRHFVARDFIRGGLVQSLHIRLYELFIVIRENTPLNDSDVKLYMLIGGQAWRQRFNTLLPTLASVAGPISITFEDRRGPPENAEYLQTLDIDVFERLEHTLVKLVLNSYIDPIPTLRYLGEDKLRKDGTSGCPCPNLETIQIQRAEWMPEASAAELIVRALEYRRLHSNVRDFEVLDDGGRAFIPGPGPSFSFELPEE